MIKTFFTVLFGWFAITTVFAETFTAGQDYIVLSNTQPTHNAKKAVVVTEFFSYGCPWCYRLEPALQRWVKQQGKNIVYQQVPVIFNQDWEYYAKAYYAAKALSLTTKLSPLLFKTILEEKKPLNNNPDMVAFFTAHGVDAATIKSAFYHSPSIDMALGNSKALMGNYQISAVPALVVNRQFKTDLKMAKSEQRLFKILDYLVAQAKQTH